MAIAFINHASAGSSTGSVRTVNKPTNTSEGDIIFALARCFATGTLTTYTGWTLLAENTDGSRRYYLLYKIAGSSEPSTYDFTFSASMRTRLTLATFRGDIRVSDPVSVISNTQYSTDNTTIRAASMSVPSSNMFLIFFGSLYNDGYATSFTKPSSPTTGWVENVDDYDTSSRFSETICSMTWSSNGNTGDMDATGRSTFAKHAFAIALNLPVVAPTVTTQAVSSIDRTTATGNGNITDTGGANATRRGFCYLQGSSGDPTTANSVVYDDGSFGTGAYTKAITGLTPNTTYRVRAYAVNSVGTSYGSTVSFTTLKADESNFLLFM